MDVKKYPISYINRLRIGSDGKGIRTLVIVQGCPLRCKFCANKFTWDGSEKPELLSAADIYERIIIDRPYIMATNGGITLGGGEPLLYPDLVIELYEICHDEMNIYIESSLNVPFENIEKIIKYATTIIVDIKSMDPAIYHEYTGGDLDQALLNLKRIIKLKGNDAIIVRIPVIPNLADEESQSYSKKELEKCGVKNIEMFKYFT